MLEVKIDAIRLVPTRPSKLRRRISSRRLSQIGEGKEEVGDMKVLRARVRESLPEIAEIKDSDLREKVVDAWALALSQTEYERIEDMPGTGGPDTSGLKQGTQVEHLRATARIALGMADGLEQVLGPCGIDRDVVIAGAVLHDVGKAHEYSAHNQARWKSNPANAGWPALRHPVYGVHIGLTVGLPESVVHVIGSHSTGGEGDLVIRSLESTIVQFADLAFWKIAERAGQLTGQMFDPAHAFFRLGATLTPQIPIEQGGVREGSSNAR
jgi:putative nucleotidyltransferase with HDIG domain